MFNLDFYKQKEEKIVKIYTVIKVATIVMAILAMVFVNHILTKERNSAEKYLEQSVPLPINKGNTPVAIGSNVPSMSNFFV